MKKFLLAVLVILCCCSVSLAAPLLTADDFIPLAQVPDTQQREELSTVQSPEAVRREVVPELEKPVTSAATAQDAINSLMKRFYDGGGEGCESVALPNGELGLVAVGAGTYGSDMKNLIAQRREKQIAYYIAFLQAKRLMAGYFTGSTIEQLAAFFQETSGNDNADSSSASNSTSFNMDTRRASAAVLKGYVTYDVRDDVKNNTVYVTLVSTPRTQGRYNRSTSETETAVNLKEGINKVFAEIQSGVVPPVGGRIVNVQETGEIAFVGFGSEVVRPSDNPRTRADNRSIARRRAALRAEAALCGIIRSDEITATENDSVNSVLNDSNYTGDRNLDLSDPIDELVSDSEKAESRNAANGFRSNDGYKQVIQSAVKGVIPPGVSPRAWLDDEGAFAYAVAVYIPSVTQKAAQMNQNMKDSKIVQDYEVRRNAQDDQQTQFNSRTYKDSGKLQQGVSGTVNQPLY